MGHYEDFWYLITEEIKQEGLQKEFDAQLEKMSHQDKHRYKETRDRWSYALDKVRKLKKDKVQSQPKSKNLE
jgi:hypothetical protein|tara:strand:- start:643 stop:858 length:216 start_codon:yes stop_codon:yes gene_type:complete